MKNFLLIISIFIISLFNINAQILYPNTYYNQVYQVQNTRTDYNSYYEINKDGNRVNFEIWYKADWKYYNTKKNENVTYYKWIYFQNCNCYNWQQCYGYGTLYYFQWLQYKQYFYFYNGVKYYN